MVTVTNWLRERILARAGIPIEDDINTYSSFEETSDHIVSWWIPFLQACFNRLILGHLRYGNIRTRKFSFDYMEYAKKKIKLYEETGNLECLVDAANVMAIEFSFPSHPNAKLEAMDDSFHATKI